MSDLKIQETNEFFNNLDINESIEDPENADDNSKGRF